MRVLLVEDNPLNQMVARAMLEGGAAAVTVAANGEEALAILRHDAGYDLVLMDVQMPVLDGLATTRLIRNELGLDLPVVAMSAGVHAREREQCSAAGMSGFLAKPLDAALLQGLLRHTTAGAGAPGMLAEVFDVAALYALNEGHAQRREELCEMIARALAAAMPQFDAAREAWRRGDAGAATRELHNLRGALGTLGATRFARLTVRIEEALHGNAGGADLAALFAEADREARHAVQCGSAWLASASVRIG